MANTGTTMCTINVWSSWRTHLAVLLELSLEGLVSDLPLEVGDVQTLDRIKYMNIILSNTSRLELREPSSQ